MELPDWLRARLQADSEVLGALLYGSRALNMAAPDSDFDLLVVTAQAPAAEQITWRECGQRAELQLMALSRWQHLHERWGWWSYGYASGLAAYDPQGVIAAGLERLKQPPETYLDGVPDLLDGYLNSTYRGVKAWRRGDQLGARLHMGQGLPMLIDALFRHSGRWTPYWDRLEPCWELLNLPGLDVALLRQQVCSVAVQPDDRAQLVLFAVVAAWMRSSGFATLLDAWDEGFHELMRP